MAVTKPPQPKKRPTEAEIEAMISKGGEVAPLASAPKAPQLAPEPEPKVQFVNARLNSEIIQQINALRANRPRKIGSPKLGVSLRDWVVEAVMEKLERESKKAR